MSQFPAPDSNPYSQPFQTYGKPPSSGGSNAKILAPGIALIITGALGLIMSFVSIGIALLGEPEPPDPALPEWLADLQAGQFGVGAAVIQVAFVLLNGLIIFGGICLVRVKSWGVALAGSIAAIVNIGNCCCVIGLPIGIWALVILQLNDVKAAFQRNA